MSLFLDFLNKHFEPEEGKEWIKTQRMDHPIIDYIPQTHYDIVSKPTAGVELGIPEEIPIIPTAPQDTRDAVNVGDLAPWLAIPAAAGLPRLFSRTPPVTPKTPGLRLPAAGRLPPPPRGFTLPPPPRGFTLQGQPRVTSAGRPSVPTRALPQLDPEQPNIRRKLNTPATSREEPFSPKSGQSDLGKRMAERQSKFNEQRAARQSLFDKKRVAAAANKRFGGKGAALATIAGMIASGSASAEDIFNFILDVAGGGIASSAPAGDPGEDQYFMDVEQQEKEMQDLYPHMGF